MVTRFDKELGLDKAITRRDFVYGSSLILGGAAIGSSGSAYSQPKLNGNYSFDLSSDWYGRLTGPFGNELVPGAYVSKFGLLGYLFLLGPLFCCP